MSSTESAGGRNRSSSSGSHLENPELVAESPRLDMRKMLPGSTNKAKPLSPSRHGPKIPIQKAEPGCFLHIRQEFKNCGIQKGARDIILQSWRDGTKQKYNTYISQWLKFCSSKRTDPFQPELRYILMFLIKLYTKGLKYNSMNVARSALSSFFLNMWEYRYKFI